MWLRKRAACLGSGTMTFVDFSKYKTVWFKPGYVHPSEPHRSDAQLRR